MTKKLLATIVLLVATAAPLLAASMSIQQMAKHRYLITHKKHSTYGGRDMVKIATTKAATACVIMGYTHYTIGDTNINGTIFQFRRGSGSVAVTFSLGEDDGIPCEPAANVKKYGGTVKVALKNVKGWTKTREANRQALAAREPC